MMTVFFTILLLNPLFNVMGFAVVGCTFDKQAIRQDDQEKVYLQESAKVYWDGIRWGIPAKSAVYYENPLVRARWERNPAVPYSRVTEVSILHIEIVHYHYIVTQARNSKKVPDSIQVVLERHFIL